MFFFYLERSETKTSETCTSDISDTGTSDTEDISQIRKSITTFLRHLIKINFHLSDEI